MDSEPSSSTGDKKQLRSKDVEKESSNLPSTSQELDQRSSIRRFKPKHDESSQLDIHFKELKLLLNRE